ncbi:MAG: DUF3343 domain-containing protein [Clostridium sp.]|nr:DUF3343 domain-containing protein [Oscillospiraceae bacterium]MBO6149622.1 DUF3343 domain-containing protein [Clostridium sp.]
MRKKEWKIVVTFHTTAEAMAMEKACGEAGAPGRMIPVPRIISAGCGLAWAAPPEAREALESLMTKVGIEREAIHECLL